jgi:hypothetical protein
MRSTARSCNYPSRVWTTIASYCSTPWMVRPFTSPLTRNASWSERYVGTVPAGLEELPETAALPRPYAYCARLHVLQNWRGGNRDGANRPGLLSAICTLESCGRRYVTATGLSPDCTNGWDFSRTAVPFVLPGLEHLGAPKHLCGVKVLSGKFRRQLDVMSQHWRLRAHGQR